MENKAITYSLIYSLTCSLVFFALITININTFACLKNNRPLIDEKKSEVLDTFAGLSNKLVKKFKKMVSKNNPKLKNELSKLKSGKEIADFMEEKEIEEEIDKRSEKKEECQRLIFIQETWKKVKTLNKENNTEKSKHKRKKNILQIKEYLEFLSNQGNYPAIKYKSYVAIAEIYFNKKNLETSMNYLEEIIFIDKNDTPEKKYLELSTIAEAYMLKARIYIEKAEKELNLSKKNSYTKKVAANSERAAKIFEQHLVNLSNPTNPTNKDNVDEDKDKDIIFFEERIIESSLTAGQYALNLIYDDETLDTERVNRYKNFARKFLAKVIDFVAQKQKIGAIIYPYMVAHKSLALNNIANLQRHNLDKKSPDLKKHLRESLRLYKLSISEIQSNMTLLRSMYSEEKIKDLIEIPQKNIFAVMRDFAELEDEEKKEKLETDLEDIK